MIFPAVSREFEGPPGIESAAIEAAARSPASYYGETLRAVEVVERYVEDLPAQYDLVGRERVTVVFRYEHETRDLTGEMVQAVLARAVGAIAQLGLECSV